MKKLVYPHTTISDNILPVNTLSDCSFNDHYIFLLTDDTGIMQHSKYSIPDPKHGYTTDDNARALIMALMLYGRYKKIKYLNLVFRYSSFLLNAQNQNGKFRNFMSYDRKWLEDEGSEDCLGRCIWALGYALAFEHTPQGIKHGLRYMLKKALPNVPEINSIRSKAYAIIGLTHIQSEKIKSMVCELSWSLIKQDEKYRNDDWKWFEDIIAYCNFVLPWSLIEAYKVSGEKRFLDTALESLNFLTGKVFMHGYFKPVGCKGWLLKGKEPAEFDEQTVEACEGVLAYLAAYDATGKDIYLDSAKKCHAWYEGVNSKGLSLIDGNTGGCYDGLTEKGVNLNMGAESIVSYVISRLKITEAKIHYGKQGSICLQG